MENQNRGWGLGRLVLALVVGVGIGVGAGAGSVYRTSLPVVQSPSSVLGTSTFEKLPEEKVREISASTSLPEVTNKSETKESFSAPKVQEALPSQSSELSNDNTYINSRGNRVHSPAFDTDGGEAPAGASAKCRDGTYSFSQSRRGTCSRHGGVWRWLP
jgi:hypothetical protein